jgi:hypothetical protein
MAIVTISGYMWPDQGKPSHLMDLCNIFNDPGFWRMAPFTFKSDSLAVNVGMTIHTFLLGLRKNQGFVTALAIKQLMLANQGEIGSIVIER